MSRHYVLPDLKLDTKSVKYLCRDFALGFCPRPTKCAPAKHTIHQILEDCNKSVNIVSSDNPTFLMANPRERPRKDSPFENDGPGELSVLGVRHDNDHVDIKDIQILPTTDEVRLFSILLRIF